MIQLKTLQKLITIFLLSLLSLGILRFEGVKTDILEAFLNKTNSEQNQLLKLSKTFSSNITILLESDTEERLELLKQDVLEEIAHTNLKTEFSKYDDLIDLYKTYPESFLSEHSRALIKSKQYNKLSKEAQKRLFNPVGIMLQTPDKDPYLLVTDYVLNLQNKNTTKIKDNKFYQKLPLVISDKNTENKDLNRLAHFKSQYGKIYISGSPIHTHKTSQKSAYEINLICVVSTILLITLCKIYFNSYKIIIPIGLSILTGFITGLVSTALIFKQLHILTLVFGTSLIGISLDYSFHYILAKIKNINITKNLTVSMLTTVIAFLILYICDVELLKQIGIFTATGLLGVYSFIQLFFSKFEFPTTYKTLKIKTVPRYIVFLIILSLIGVSNIKFNDNIKSFYLPDKNLLQSEQLTSEIFNTKSISFITINGKNISSNLEKETILKKELNKQNINSISITDFIPSLSVQKENRTLVKELYSNNLDSYAKFLPDEQKQYLKTNIQTPTNIFNTTLVQQFSLDKNTTYIIVFGTPQNITSISLPNKISDIIQTIRIKCLKVIPIIFLVYFIVLTICYRPLKSLKIITSPLIASLFSIVFVSSLGEEINVFHILSIFLILGFSLDYSIFMANGDKNSKDAIFISFITSFISFILLSLTSFKLISSMGLVISIGLATSYILSSALFSAETEIK